MTWSIKASGTKEACRAAVKAATNQYGDKRQHDAAKAFLLNELELYADGAEGVEVSAHGHVPDGEGSRTLFFSVSGPYVHKADLVATETNTERSPTSEEDIRAASELADRSPRVRRLEVARDVT